MALLQEVIRQWRARFEDAGIDTPLLDARLLGLHVAETRYEELIADPGLELSQQGLDILTVLCCRRLEGEPLAYILGEKEFWGHRFIVTPDTLIPRPDTETLVETVLRRFGTGDHPETLLDLGTGSGCLLVTLLKEFPDARGVGVDVNKGGIKVAQENASYLGVAERCSFVAGNWFEPFTGKFDLIVSNPPYVRGEQDGQLADSVKRFEPPLALYGGEDGLDPLRVILKKVGDFLHAGGFFVCEIGVEQDLEAKRLFEAAGISDIDIVPDLNNIPRCIVGRWAS